MRKLGLAVLLLTGCFEQPRIPPHGAGIGRRVSGPEPANGAGGFVGLKKAHGTTRVRADCVGQS